MLATSLITLASLLSATRAAQLCGQWDSELEASGRYYLENNLWGESGYTGSQCSQATASSGTAVTWYTSYTWAGGPYQVKSYANLDLQVGTKVPISSISSIPSVWKWTYTSASSDLVADVSYDLWLSTSSSGTGASSTSSYEIMIWLSSRGGAGPAGSLVGTVTVNGLSWKLYQGVVSTWTVFSFVPPSELTNFSEDLLPFITYLCNTYGISKSQYLVALQAGTEPFIGTAYLSTSSYSSVINTGGTINTTTKAATTTTKTTTTTTKAATTTAKASTTTTKAATTTAASGATQSHYGQCGGTGYSGPTTCASPYTCTYSNAYYSQCL